MKTDQPVSVSGLQEGAAASDAIWILMPGFVGLENKNQRKLLWGEARIGHLDLNQASGEGEREGRGERELVANCRMFSCSSHIKLKQDYAVFSPFLCIFVTIWMIFSGEWHHSCWRCSPGWSGSGHFRGVNRLDVISTRAAFHVAQSKTAQHHAVNPY